MSTSMNIAYILFPLFAVFTIAAFTNPKFYRQMLKDSVEHNALLFMMGAMALVGGTAIILFHNTWNANLTTAITVIGWLMILKGAIRLLFPEVAKRMILWAANKNTIYGAAFIGLIISVLLFLLMR